jgi:hypothetical protein
MKEGANRGDHHIVTAKNRKVGSDGPQPVSKNNRPERCRSGLLSILGGFNGSRFASRCRCLGQRFRVVLFGGFFDRNRLIAADALEVNHD